MRLSFSEPGDLRKAVSDKRHCLDTEARGFRVGFGKSYCVHSSASTPPDDTGLITNIHPATREAESPRHEGYSKDVIYGISRELDVFELESANYFYYESKQNMR